MRRLRPLTLTIPAVALAACAVAPGPGVDGRRPAPVVLRAPPAPRVVDAVEPPPPRQNGQPRLLPCMIGDALCGP